MPNPALLADDSFREDCRMSTIPDYLLVLSRCAGCGHLDKLSGGYCSNCADPLPDEDDEAQAPAITSGGVIKPGAGQDRLVSRR